MSDSTTDRLTSLWYDELEAAQNIYHHCYAATAKKIAVTNYGTPDIVLNLTCLKSNLKQKMA